MEGMLSRASGRELAHTVPAGRVCPAGGKAGLALAILTRGADGMTDSSEARPGVSHRVHGDDRKCAQGFSATGRRAEGVLALAAERM